MPQILEGGTPTTTKISVTTAVTPLAAARSSGASRRTALVVQNVGTVDVFIGGAGVASSGSSQGLLLIGNPDNTTQPKSMSITSTFAAIYGITASGTASVVVYEELT